MLPLLKKPSLGADVQLPADIKPYNSFESHRAAGAEQTEAPPTRVAVLRTPAVGVPVRTLDRVGDITRHEQRVRGRSQQESHLEW